jgi:hypothetical protein
MTLKGTPQFMAPEVLRNHGKGYTEKADIWSVGCTVIEMCTARRPWPEFNTNEAVMYHVAMRDARPKTPDWVSEECKDFCSLCFARDATERPNVAQLLRHPLVHNAELEQEQRLGTNSADPAEISLDLHAHDGAHTNAANPSKSRPPAGDAAPASEDVAAHAVAGASKGGVQIALEPDSALAPGSKRLAAKGKGPMGGVVLREDPDDEEDEESSCSSDDGDEDGARTPAVETLMSCQHIRKGSYSSTKGALPTSTSHMPLDLLSADAVRSARRPLPESLVRDVDSALEMVEKAHQLVQSVTSNRQKCFSLAQKMRRAKIPLEKLLELDGVDDDVRNAVMDIRY